MAQEFCFKCGECCKDLNLVISGEEWRILEEAAGRIIEVTQSLVDKNRFSIKGRCPLLTSDNLCSIYSNRPCQCRLYHCGRLKPEGKKLEWMSEIQKLMRENPEYRAWRTQMEDEGTAWGNTHGWDWRKR